MRPVRIAVTGAAGQIGYSLVYRLAAGDAFPGRRIELRLLDVAQALPVLDGVAMELDDCASPLLAGIEVGDDPWRIFDGVDVALLVGASPRRAGMERSDLLAVNGGIFAAQGKALTAASSDLRVVVTGNPANTNAYIAMRNADGVPPERFTALTRLDHDRARSLLARHVRRPVSDVTRMTIWGNHSATQYPDVYNARIGGRPAIDWVGDAWVNFDYLPAVARRGAAIIAARGRSSAASAANATIEHVRDWFAGTPDGDWTSMAVASQGVYGIPDGLICSLPVTAREGAWEVVEGLAVNAFSRTKIDASVRELQAEIESLRHLRLGVM